MTEPKVHEEFRKLQLTGRTSYVISLPKTWINQMGLESGDQIEIRTQEDSLVLTPHPSKREEKPREATVTVAKAGELQALSRKIISLYLVGYEIIHVRAENALDAAQMAMVKHTIHGAFIGAEIVSESDREIVIQILGSPNFSVEHAFRRIAALTSSMSEDVASSLKTVDKNKLGNIISLDNEVNRFSFYVVRQLKSSVHDERLVKRIGLTNQKECLGYRIETKDVERIADSIVSIAKRLQDSSNSKTKLLVPQNVSELVLASTSLFEDVMKAHFKRDSNLAESIISEALELEEHVKKARLFILTSKLDAVEQVGLIEILESIRQIVNYCKEIAEVLLNRTIEESPAVAAESLNYVM